MVTVVDDDCEYVPVCVLPSAGGVNVKLASSLTLHHKKPSITSASVSDTLKVKSYTLGS